MAWNRPGFDTHGLFLPCEQTYLSLGFFLCSWLLMEQLPFTRLGAINSRSRQYWRWPRRTLQSTPEHKLTGGYIYSHFPKHKLTWGLFGGCLGVGTNVRTNKRTNKRTNERRTGRRRARGRGGARSFVCSFVCSFVRSFQPPNNPQTVPR